MKKFLLLSLTLFLFSCTKSNLDDKKLTQVVRAFSGHLYIYYNRYSDRPRKDNIGKFKNTWPLSPRAHDPHDKPGVKPMKME